MNALQLKGSASPVEIKRVTQNLNFIRQYKGDPNAETYVSDHSAHRWDAQNAGALTEFEEEAEQAEATAIRAEEEAKQAEDRCAKTDQYDIGADARDEEGNPLHGEATPFMQWPLFERLTVGGMLIAVFLLLGLGAVNVAVTILGSGNPIFLDAPYLAWLLGAILPAAAFAAKAGYHLCEHDKDRHAYAWAVFNAAGISILIWIVLFCLSFEGSTGEIDWSDLEAETASHSIIHTLRNISQILSEILCGAALFLVVDRMFARHSPYHVTERPGWREMRAKADELRSKADVLRDLANASHAAVAQLRAARAVHIAEAIGFLRDL